MENLTTYKYNDGCTESKTLRCLNAVRCQNDPVKLNGNSSSTVIAQFGIVCKVKIRNQFSYFNIKASFEENKLEKVLDKNKNHVQYKQLLSTRDIFKDQKSSYQTLYVRRLAEVCFQEFLPYLWFNHMDLLDYVTSPLLAP